MIDPNLWQFSWGNERKSQDLEASYFPANPQRASKTSFKPPDISSTIVATEINNEINHKIEDSVAGKHS